MKPKICLAICNNFIQEFNKIISDESLEMVKVVGLPCSCVQGRCPKPLVNISVSEKHEECNEIHLLQCGYRGIPSSHEATDDSVKIVHNVLGNCFDLFANNSIIEHHLSKGAYLTTPGWVCNWAKQIADWGFDQETAREFFSEFSTRVVLLDTGILSDASRKCREFAQYLGLPCEIQPVGLDYCSLKVKEIVRNWEFELSQKEIAKLQKVQARHNSEMATILDLLAELTLQSEETEVLDCISSLFSILFAPGNLAVCSIHNGEIFHEASLPMESDQNNTIEVVHARLQGMYEILPGKEGFAIRFGKDSTTNGLAVVSNLAFPEKMTGYISQAINLSHVCNLAIDNTRALRGFLPICSFCKKIRTPRGRWQQMETFISEHSQAFFSHTYCEECFSKHYDDLMK